MAERPMRGAKTGEDLRRALWVAGLLLGTLSFGLYLHAVWDGAPTVWESVRPRAAEVDPFAVLWFPSLAGFLLAVGAATRLRYGWVALAALAVFGTFFFTEVGWAYLLAAALLAAVAGQIPPRGGTRAKKGRLTSS